MPRRRCCCSPLTGCCWNLPVRVDFTLTDWWLSGVPAYDATQALLFGNVFHWGFANSLPPPSGFAHSCGYDSIAPYGVPPLTFPVAFDGGSILSSYLLLYHRWVGPGSGVVRMSPEIWVDYSFPDPFGGPPIFGTNVFRQSDPDGFASTTELLEAEYCNDPALMAAALAECINACVLDSWQGYGSNLPFSGALDGPITLSTAP